MPILDGLKVLDLSWGIAGPMTGMLLADHGAAVTRIERPQGDPFPDMLGYKVWHRGKRSAVLDLKQADDLALFLRLAGEADILIESFRPGVTHRLGIDYDTLAAVNPKLIYCSISAYGEGTPDEQRPGYDALVGARSGLQFEQRGWPEGSVWHMTGRPNPYVEAAAIEESWLQGAEREGPLFVASTWPSLGAFFSASTGISAALFHREKTGEGQRVATSLLQGALVSAPGVWQRMEEPDAEGFNSWIFGSKSPKGHFRTADGRWIHSWVPNPRFILQAAAGDSLDATPDLSVQSDPDRFGVGPEEVLVMAHYQPLLADAVGRFSADEWVQAAATADVPLQECRPVETALTDPMLIADGCVATVDDPELGPINQVGITYRVKGNPGRIAGPAPIRGADTEEVKREAAMLPLPAAQARPASLGRPPLAGIRVIDLGLAIAGPFGCQLLSDLGADVIKINTLWDGYWHRTHVAYCANRGKRSIALMLKNPKAMAILRELIASADIVQHNMRYDAVKRLGLDYETLSQDFPKLIYCHTRGFEDGPRKNLPGNDQTGACLAGIQHEDGAVADGGRPLWSFTSFGDTGNGFLSAIAMLQALRERERTGRGQFVDTSIVNACLLNTSYAVAKPDGTPVARPRLDALQTGLSRHYRLYEAADGWIQVAAVTERQRRAFDDMMSEDAAERIRARSCAAVLADLERAGVPAELSDPEASLRMFDNDLYRERSWTVAYRDEAVGMLEQIGHSYSLSSSPGVIQGSPLVVGDHTQAILTDLGYAQAEIDALVAEGAIACNG